jgi:hypothetical protein
MNLRLDDEEAAALREAARLKGMSMQQATKQAIFEWVARSRMLTTAELLALPRERDSIPLDELRAALEEARSERPFEIPE